MDSNRYASPRFKLAVVVSNTARAGKYAALRVFLRKKQCDSVPTPAVWPRRQGRHVRAVRFDKSAVKRVVIGKFLKIAFATK
jgi:hypothetical protein